MIETHLFNLVKAQIADAYGVEITKEQFQFQRTRKEFEGDFTIVVFPFTRFTKLSPEQTAATIGESLVKNAVIVESFNVIKGFLNLVIKNNYWFSFVSENFNEPEFGKAKPNGNKVVIEFSSPNTNKPLHLGHIRNNLLGHSVSQILSAAGNEVMKVNLVNDRGIHICKSMIAWQKWGAGETPETSGLKGDHLVGKYYVLFDKYYKAEVAKLVQDGLKPEEAEKQAPLLLEAQEMLRKWEAGDPEVVALWKQMNGWVYEGFDDTYKTLGISFDKTYYESQTYLLGKEIVKDGLEKKVFVQREDNSVWIDLTADGLDEKLLLRSDGTSVYMTQDLGTAMQRHNEFKPDELIYVVGNEQEYHFQVLKLVLKHLGEAWAEKIYHLSYGMVELPHGKMKSREGTVVDADDLMQQMFDNAEATAKELGKIADLSAEEAQKLYKTIGLGALKYFILKVDPKKNMLFNPEESIDFNGNTGPFIQYTYARIRSVLRKAENEPQIADFSDLSKMDPLEKELILTLYGFPAVLKEAGEALSPAQIANYIYELATVYNRFYHDLPILKEENESLRSLRLILSRFTSHVIRHAMSLLGIDVPERM